MPDVQANGIRLYYEERGEGAPIVCIHGSSSSARMWPDAAIDELARLGRVIVYDRRAGWWSLVWPATNGSSMPPTSGPSAH